MAHTWPNFTTVPVLEGAGEVMELVEGVEDGSEATEDDAVVGISGMLLS